MTAINVELRDGAGLNQDGRIQSLKNTKWMENKHEYLISKFG